MTISVFIVIFSAIRTSISDDWSSTGFMEAAAELESSNDKEKIREKRDKERQKERAKVCLLIMFIIFCLS